MDYTADEEDEARRDMMGLVRARHDGDAEGVEAILAGILDTSGARGLQALADALAQAFYGMLALRTLAVRMLPADKQEAMDATDIEDLLSDPAFRESIGASLAYYQAGILGDDA